MKLCLLNPPLCVHEFPHLALPLLKGYLSQAGIPCTIQDFNVEIMDAIVQEGLEKVEKYFYDRGLRIGYKEIKNRFENAKKVFLMKDMVGKEDRAQKLINTYLRIAGSNIYDICFRPDSLEKIKMEYTTCDIQTSSNPILKYIRNRILPYIEKNSFTVVGISVPFTSQIFYALLIGREIKRRMPACRVVLGGPQISLFWRNIMEYEPFRDAFDEILYGLGEVALERYIRVLENHGSLKDVPNLIFINRDGALVVNKEEKVRFMQDIPQPDFSDLPLDRYIFAKLPYQMTRGCYWSQCAFCSYRNTKGYIKRDVEQVIDHIQTMEKRYGRHIFQFIDDAIHPSILRQLSDELIARNVKIRYDAYLRLDKEFTPELCKQLRKSGLKTVLFGFESANQRMLDVMKKGNSPENMANVLKNMHRAGIQSILSCLIGFPTETKEEAWDSIRFLRENRPYYYWVYIVHFGLISDMCQEAERYGLTDIKTDTLIRYDDTGFAALGYPYRTTKGMSVEESYKIIQQGRKELGITIFPDNFFS